jgi:hypothetical protein
VTAKTYIRRLKTLNKTVDLDQPEKVKNIICTYPSSEAYKQLLTNAYDYYVKFKGLSWVLMRIGFDLLFGGVII